MPNPPPAPPPTRPAQFTGQVTKIRTQPKRLRIFWSDSASRAIPVPSQGRLLQFQLLNQHGGQWAGHYCTSDPVEITALEKAAVTTRGVIREITPNEFKERTKIDVQSWKIEDYILDDAVQVNRIELPPLKPRKPTIAHCVERHKQVNDETFERVINAVQSWLTLYQMGEMTPCHVWKYPRSARDLGDSRELPYLKDILKRGLDTGAEIVVLTNDDTVLHHETGEIIRKMLKKIPACCSGRTNFTPGQDISKLWASWAGDIGRDLFAFRATFLRDNFDEIPDFLLGELEWDLILSALIRLKVTGKKTTVTSRDQYDPKYELPPGYVWHQKHVREWQQLDRFNAPSKKHNVALARAWYKANGMEDLIAR